MKVGVISDTHDRLPAIARALERFRDHRVDAIIHPGDIVAPFAAKPLAALGVPLHVTYGNNDGERAGLKRVLPQIQDGPLLLQLAGKTILVHHFLDWCAPGDVSRADVIITGHTHEVLIEQREAKLFLNPGECCGWVTGRATVAVLDVPTLEVELIELSL
jgi:hypothetical protein